MVHKQNSTVYVREDNNLPYLPNIITSFVSTSYYAIMGRFGTCVSVTLPNNPNYSYDSTGFAGNSYIYKGDVSNMLIAKGRPKLIKEFKDTVIYYFRIDSVVNAEAYFRGKDGLFFIAKNNDSVKHLIDNTHILFLMERKPYMDESPINYHRLYSVFERATTLPAMQLLVNFKLSYGLGRPGSGWNNSGAYNKEYVGKWYLKPDRYDKCITKYLKNTKQ
jgi:hypothetical protein